MTYYAVALITLMVPLCGWIGMVRYEVARGESPPRAGLGAIFVLVMVFMALLVELETDLSMPIASWWAQ